MVARLFTAIVAFVLTSLGVVFGIVGLVADTEGAAAMAILGGVLLAIGLVLAGVEIAYDRSDPANFEVIGGPP